IAVALQGLRGAPELTIERYRRVVEVLAVSAERCWRERSRFSSANNHLIGEMAGLAVIAMLFPDLPGAQRWERRAVHTLSTEAPNLILPDGCGAEQSVAYQIATVELLQLITGLLLDRDGRAPEAITDAISRSSAFLANIVGENDPDPRYGDADQEFAVRLGPEEERTVREHLGIAAALGCEAGRAVQHEPTLAAEWYRRMLSAAASEVPEESGAGGIAPNFVAPYGGLVVFRRGRRRITMDIGSLGYLSIAAHGHADALAVTVSDDGRDVIGDPGTGSYYQHPQWRAVMRGTRAHATVCVDGEDQSVIGGPFMWSRHANTRVRGIDVETGVVDAEHDGYLRLPGHVMHRRWLIAPPGDRSVLVVDLISGTGIHEVRTTWPLHPALGASSTGTGHIITRDDVPVFELLHAATRTIALEGSFGDDEQTLGWWSELLESRTPAWWLSGVCSAELPIAMATLISPVDGTATCGLNVTLNGESIAVGWTENRVERRKTIRIDTPATVA
nr:heparinase II/III family protein [Mycobacterium sp.]